MRQSLLYKFQRSSESRVNYILGTMHVKSADAYTPVSAAKRYMEVCSIYAGEVNLNDPELSNLEDVFRSDVDLIDLIGEKKYDKYRKVIKKSFKVDLNSLSHYKPMVISNMLAESVMTAEYDLALDHFLWQCAQALGMEMTGLESGAEQAQIMKSIPLETQLKSLKSAVKNVSKFRKKVLQLSQYYSEGDLKRLYKASKKSMGELRALMIYDRNIHMAERIQQITADKASFIAVGAAHLSGKKGILKLLKDKGFKIKPIAIH